MIYQSKPSHVVFSEKLYKLLLLLYPSRKSLYFFNFTSNFLQDVGFMSICLEVQEQSKHAQLLLDEEV